MSRYTACRKPLSACNATALRPIVARLKAIDGVKWPARALRDGRVWSTFLAPARIVPTNSLDKDCNQLQRPTCVEAWNAVSALAQVRTRLIRLRVHLRIQCNQLQRLPGRDGDKATGRECREWHVQGNIRHVTSFGLLASEVRLWTSD
ncbi:hypothetical protein [Ancylobacter aquaticus]|uniref:hypothetical protein n=1 Tax=Ancylobacter aquaticus TaxID=100 RepID=UPI0014043967|nr:hypothetical protein [Ancylobacter aquaticus]